MSYLKLMAGVVFVGLFAACQQAPEPEPIAPQPIYNKYGEVVGCEGGDCAPMATQ